MRHSDLLLMQCYLASMVRHLGKQCLYVSDLLLLLLLLLLLFSFHYRYCFCIRTDGNRKDVYNGRFVTLCIKNGGEGLVSLT